MEGGPWFALSTQVFATYKTLKDGKRKAYWYHRATGIRLEGELGERAFILSYAEAERTRKARHSGDTFMASLASSPPP